MERTTPELILLYNGGQRPFLKHNAFLQQIIVEKEKSDKSVKLYCAEASNKRHFIAIALLIASVFLSYSNSINGTWAMDDILANKAVGIKDLQEFAGSRKITYLTFLLNNYIAPFSPANFRIFNILIHIFNSVLVYVIAYKTIMLAVPQPKADGKGEGRSTSNNRSNLAFYAALLSSVIFALHPININAVAYIVQRMASLAALFTLLTLICYISATQAGNRFKAAGFYILSCVSMLAGIFSKENAVMAIPLIFLYDYVFISKFEGRLFIKKFYIIFSLGIAGAAVAAYYLSFHHLLKDLFSFFINYNQPLTDRVWMAVDVYWTPLQHILTEFRVVSRYIFLILAPLPQFLVFDWWGFHVSKGLTEPVTTILSIIFLAALFVFSLWKIKRFPLLCFGILWYLISISLESFIAIGSDLYFEYRNYLPFSGLIIGIVGQILPAFNGKLRTKTVWSVTAVFCILLGALTFTRNFVWKDSQTLYQDSIKKNPANIRAIMGLGNAYLKMYDLINTERYYAEAVRISSKDKRATFLNDSVYSLGMIYLYEGKLDPAKRLIDMLDLTIASYKPKILSGFYKARSNDLEGALRDYNEVIGNTSGLDTVIVHTLMGDAYREKGLLDNAIEQYSKAISLDQGFSAAYYGTAVAYMGKRNLTLADEYFSKTLAIDPENILALSDMADLMLIRKSNPGEALAYAQKAVSKNSQFYQPYLTMANVLIILGRENEADEFYNKAIERKMPEYLVPFSKARSYYMKGNNEKANYYLSELHKHKLPENIKNLTKGK